MEEGVPTVLILEHIVSNVEHDMRKLGMEGRTSWVDCGVWRLKSTE